MIYFTIIIFIILIIIISNNKNENFSNKKLKLAVYCYNFGNFRNELTKTSIDRFKKDNRLDYYFYTNENIISKKWRVVKVPLLKRTKHMNANRVTAKYYKWKYIPKELKDYDYILHVDCKRIDWLNIIKYDDIISLINNNPNTLFFARKHPFLNSTYDECNYVKKNTDFDNNDNIDTWLIKLKNDKFKQKITHTETSIWIKKNSYINNILPKVYELLMRFQLCRDQHVFTYVIQNSNLKSKEFMIYDKFSKL